jgi:hypothetical protein
LTSDPLSSVDRHVPLVVAIVVVVIVVRVDAGVL